MKRMPIVLLLCALTLAGCTAQPSPTPSPSVDPVSAADTCKQVSNVLTVLGNAGISRSEDRSTQQELDGAIALADTMLDDVETPQSGNYEAVVDRLRSRGTDEYALTAISNGSDPWMQDIADLNELCTANGTELAVNLWTGG